MDFFSVPHLLHVGLLAEQESEVNVGKHAVVPHHDVMQVAVATPSRKVSTW
jgi:hypothetical protein